MTTPLLTWVHLSDIHAGHGDATQRWDQALVMETLIADLEQLGDRGDPAPDLILVTGDLAYSGGDKNGEYDAVRVWLERAACAVGVAPTDVFLVPGNHDVSWKADDNNNDLRRLRDALRADRADKESLDNVLSDAKDRKLLLRRQRAYLEFAKHFAPDSAEPFWHHQRAINGIQLRLIGLNTALLAWKDDKGKLDLGLEQWVTATRNKQPGELVVVMSHHPLVDGWLRRQSDVRRRIRADAHIHLAGHVHVAESEEARSGNGTDMVTIIAGAAHAPAPADNEVVGHGYNLAAVYPSAAGNLELRVWPRLWSTTSQSFRTDIHGVPDRQHLAVHRLGLRNP